MARQIELADDLGPQQRDDVRADGEAEAGKDLFRDRRAAEDMTALEDEHGSAGPGEIGSGGQTVVATADDDDVVAHRRESYPVAYGPPKGGHYDTVRLKPDTTSRRCHRHDATSSRPPPRRQPRSRWDGIWRAWAPKRARETLPRARPAADAAVIELANEALNAARGAGASYADVRIGRYRRQQHRDA